MSETRSPGMKGPSQEEILAIARRRGHFFVSMRYRDDYLLPRCRKLVKKGLLRRDNWRKYGERGSYFIPAEPLSV